MSTKKGLNLVAAIRATENEIAEVKAQHRLELEPLEEALTALRKINTVCERCNGKGKILRSRACAEDDRPDPDDPSDYIKCPECGGSGKAKYSE